jgi:hypothetical protein
MPQLRVCDERAAGADDVQGQIPAAEACLGSALRSPSQMIHASQTRLKVTASFAIDSQLCRARGLMAGQSFMELLPFMSRSISARLSILREG